MTLCYFFGKVQQIPSSKQPEIFLASLHRDKLFCDSYLLFLVRDAIPQGDCCETEGPILLYR